MTQIGTDEERLRALNALTERVIGCAFAVGNTLGPGFLEKVYENALAHELRKAGLRVEQQHRLTVWYDGVKVGEYVPDLLVQEFLLVEIKAGKGIDDSHRAQCINAMAASRLPACLLLNFSKRVEVKRFLGPDLASSSHLCPSVSSVASSSSPRPSTFPPVAPGEVPITWGEAAEFADLEHAAQSRSHEDHRDGEVRR
ncbi:MAG: GxxExxY protein [Phycisphaerales bacterium]